MTIDELVEAALAGDSKAEQELARRLDVVLRAALRPQWQKADREDLVQSTLEVTFRKLKQFKPQGPNSFIKWVRGIAHLHIKKKLDRLALTTRHKGKVAGLNPTPDRGLSSILMLANGMDLLSRELERLTDVQRQAIMDFLAREFGGTAKVDHAALQRALSKLRTRLRQAMANPLPSLTKHNAPEST
jgi:DNA-directed RNA polymerase specialized sigma24 family protein